MKICHVITRLILGGAQENTLLTVIGQQRNPRYRVTLLCGIDAQKRAPQERPAQHRPVMRETGEAGLAVVRTKAAFAQPAKRKVFADHVRDGVIEADSA